MLRSLVLLLPIAALFAADTTIAPPAGSTYRVTFATEDGQGPEALFDGDEKTFMASRGGQITSPTQGSSLVIRFQEPLADLAGVETGDSDPHHNYYPKIFEFWVDSNGDGRHDTLLGQTDSLGPAAQSKGVHRFTGRLKAVHGLEIRCREQNTAGGARGWTMNEMRLLIDPSLPLAKATPNLHRVTYYREPMPTGATATASVPTEENGPAAMVLDGNPNTRFNPKQGTARKGVSVSLFLRWPEPVQDLAGIVLGESDPYHNYRWERMEFWIDTTGDGTYDHRAGVASGGNAGEKRFAAPAPLAHGIELRVVQQKLGGAHRAFVLAEVEGLVFRDDFSEREMRYVVEDFEDLSSWRLWGENTAQPEGARLYGGYSYVCGIRHPDAPGGDAIGQLRYTWKEPQPGKVNWVRAKRGTVALRESIPDRLLVQANPQGFPCKLSFEFMDAKGRKVRSPEVALVGDAWQEYAFELGPEAWPEGNALTLPLRIEHLFLTSEQGGSGDVLLDDITVVGTVGRNQRVTIAPRWQGMAYDPTRSVQVEYRVRNALDTAITAPIIARLYSSYDAKKQSPVVEKTVTATLAPWKETVIPIDFGRLDYGHYEVVLTLDTEGVAARGEDFVAVATLNGGRVNRSPMWIGAQHPGSWISDAENAFVFQEVVRALGMDCYRTGAPEKHVLDSDLLLAAGFGDLPKHLQKPDVKRANIDEPNDYVAYANWVREQARTKYAPYVDRILSVEFYNEPDLPDFCYIPDIDVYLKMWRTWAKAMREGAPGIKLGTGGNTVQHAKEKKDFNARMYTELAQEADVAVWHAHGGLANYSTRHRMVENWLTKGGRPVAQQQLGNSEAGTVSRNSAIERLSQAVSVVQKIGWAKAQQNSLFYTWFTTTDTYDPQGGYMVSDNWGLITFNQRLKPSGLAMNELIRNLANTTGAGEMTLDSRLQSLAFTRDDGAHIVLSWPQESGSRFLQTLRADGPVEHCDLFGKRSMLQPKEDVISFAVNGYPFYLIAAKGVTVSAGGRPDWVQLPDMVGVAPGSEVAFTATFTNPWDKPATLVVRITDLTGNEVTSASLSLARGATVEHAFRFALPSAQPSGSLGYIVQLSSNEAGLDGLQVPLTVAVGERVPRSDQPLVEAGKPTVPTQGARIVVDHVTAIHDLVDDPTTPKWINADDLAVTATVSHDADGLLLHFVVTDQAHHPGPPGAGLWAKDSIQIGIAADGQQTEIGLTEAGGGAGFCWMSPVAEKVGAPLRAPLTVTRAGKLTTYTVYLPFADLGFTYTPGKLVRLTFAVNEDDGKGRVRLMKWYDGIHPSKDVQRFGYLILE